MRKFILLAFLLISFVAPSQITEQWIAEYDNFSGNDIATAIALDPSGNVIVPGMSWDGLTDEYDYVTIKYNGNTGSQMWLQEFDLWSLSDKATSVAVDANGDVYVTGAADDGSILHRWQAGALRTPKQRNETE